MSNRTLFPPPYWESWPGTRIGGLLYVGVVACALLVVCATPGCWKTRATCLPRSRQCPWSCIQPVLVGLLIGLFIHFIPCIWWTCVQQHPRVPPARPLSWPPARAHRCDWGEHDGAAVRGGIWFITWAVVAIGMAIANCTRQDKGAGGDLTVREHVGLGP